MPPEVRAADGEKKPGERGASAPRSGTESQVQPAAFIHRPSIRAAVGGEFGLPGPQGSIAASVMARVNGQPILLEEVMNSAQSRLVPIKPRVPESQWEEVRDEVIQSELELMIDRELILQDAASKIRPQGMEKIKEAALKDFESTLRRQKEQMKLRTDEEYRALLEKDGASLEEMKRQFERTFISQEYVRFRIKAEMDKLCRNDLLDYYHKNLKDYDKPERVVWQHIFIDVDRYKDNDEARRQAEKVLAQVKAIKASEEFGPLAEKYAHGPSQYRKGEGEGTERGAIRPADVEDLVFRLQPGQTGPLVEAPRGYHIVRVASRQPAGRVPFEKACAEIRKKLQNQTFQAEYNRIIKELRSKAYIETASEK